MVPLQFFRYFLFIILYLLYYIIYWILYYPTKWILQGAQSAPFTILETSRFLSLSLRQT